MLLSVTDVIYHGIKFVSNSFVYRNDEQAYVSFRSIYGSSPLDLASMWFDLCNSEILNTKEKNMKGFKRFLMAHYFLWQYPKNAKSFARVFDVCEVYARGRSIWQWVEKIQSLYETTIVWPDELDSPEGAIFTISVDGVDFRTYEKKHPTLPRDTKGYSQKHNHYALKYEIGISLNTSKCVWTNGPFLGGKNDVTIFGEGLKQKLAAHGKLGLADRGYPGQVELSLPNTNDPGPLKKFKSRGRARHETFNRRLKCFQCLADTFRHNLDKHKIAFQAVCVIVQYQMDNGAELFEI